jgi:hypothetical protein
MLCEVIDANAMHHSYVQATRQGLDIFASGVLRTPSADSQREREMTRQPVIVAGSLVAADALTRRARQIVRHSHGMESAGQTSSAILSEHDGRHGF